jgi:CheY-like chemotaxis protein
VYKIFVVDDEEDTVELATLILQYEGYEVISASDGQIALDKLQKGDEIPDLILLDILMPRMDGLELCRWIKKQKKLKDIPVVFFTAKVGSKDKEECLKAGAADYIAKPFSTNELFVILKKYLN